MEPCKRRMGSALTECLTGCVLPAGQARPCLWAKVWALIKVGGPAAEAALLLDRAPRLSWSCAWHATCPLPFFLTSWSWLLFPDGPTCHRTWTLSKAGKSESSGIKLLLLSCERKMDFSVFHPSPLSVQGSNSSEPGINKQPRVLKSG